MSQSVEYDQRSTKFGLLSKARKKRPSTIFSKESLFESPSLDFEYIRNDIYTDCRNAVVRRQRERLEDGAAGVVGGHAVLAPALGAEAYLTRPFVL